ncbi:PAS domain S-box protein [Rhizobium sp. GN54]|uniref:PAS domain S-box protein n=1 Tax=Rhizobium sp. GN54 TaxID=2898150 RepID=UPI001E45574B|nr:PAS domain S-box protein [Rhizobium sp. GN54]MCD2183375.1 PAS domain S-box protein [Rhizobium sp. GN54]
MSAHQYPFIDVAVHERVRLPFARGEAVVLFSIDMRQVLWSNGRGAGLFGHGSIYDFLDAPVPEGDVVFRQLQTAARQLGQSGLGRNLLLRIGTGYRGLPVSAHVERISLAPGQDAVLFSTPAAGKSEPMSLRAASLLTGFDDPDTHMAVLDGEGGILAASPGFAALGISDDARLRMVAAARRESDGLVKRPIPTGKGLLPAALGRISADPALNLLFAVETILGHMDPEHDAPAAAGIEPPALAGETISPDAAATVSTSEQDEPDEPGNAADDEAEEHAAAERANGDVTASAAPEDEGAGDLSAALPVEAAAPAEDDSAPADANASAKSAAPVAAADPAISFERASRPVRFVWKIDAEGHFSELSSEFSEVVGPHAADVIGLPFAEVAQRFDFDRDGTIAELLRRRDTWSGKTIHWPVEGTRLRVPVDLAALPTYSRSREFDGFRGFGIVRTADAIDDENALGLAIAGTVDAEAGLAAEHDDAEAPLSTPAPSVLDELLAEEAGEERLADDDATAAAEIANEAEADDLPEDDAPDSAAGDDPLRDETGTDIHPDDDFRGERPALRLVDTPARRQSEKVVQLDNRRGRTGALTTGEQAAFREIARQLGETFGKRRSGEISTAPAEGDTGDAAHSPEARNGVDDGKTAASAPVDALPEDRDEIPGLEVGEHADDVPAKSASITGPRTAMDYGLTASVVDALPVALLIHAGDILIHANPEFLELTGFASLDALEGAGGLAVLLDRPAAEDEAPEGTMLLRHAEKTNPLAVNARLQSIRWESGTALMLALSPVGPPVPSPAPSPVDAAAIQAGPEARAGDTAPEDDEDETLETLRDEANELRSILETATDGVVVVDQEGEIRSINRSASALFNYDEDEIRGKPFAVLFAHESQKAVIDYLAGLAGHGVASVLNDGREVIGREASGGFIPLFMTMGRLSSSSGYCAVIRDITQWKRTEEELRNAKRAAETANAHKSEFLARVSHEIRTPLNAIIGFSDMMAGERFGPIGHPRYVEYANDIGRSGRHVLDIVNDLLDISKIEAGEMELDFTAVGLNETVSEAVSLVQPQANGQRVIIRTSLSTSVPPVVADLRSVKQIALNILANAIRFTPSGGQIVVSTSYENNGSVVLRIRDTGVGMTRSELEQAMKPFRQVTTGARKRGDGTGLGLPLTKAMVDANRAHFAISSSPNEGTLVEVTFPSPRVLAV